MRGKEPVSNWGPEDEEDEELIWERLRASQTGGAAPGRARSEVVPRTRVAGEPQVAADPYATYANQVQSTRETPAYGVSAVQVAYQAAAQLDDEMQGELQEEDEEEEDEEAIWERLRSGKASDRVSDIAALGAHQAYDREPIEDEQTTAYAQEQAYAQQQYEQQQQAYAQQRHEQQQQAYAQQQYEQQQYEQQQVYAQQQYEQQQYEQQQAYAQQQYEQQQYEQQQAYAQQQYEQQQYEQAQLFAQQQGYEQQQSYEQAYAQQAAYEQQQLFGQQSYGGSPYMREAHQADPFSPLPAHAAQPLAAPQQGSRASLEPTWIGDAPDEAYAPKRGRGVGITLVAGILLAAAGGLAMRYVQQAAPTLVQASSDVSAASMAAPAAEPSLGADEARARDAVFGTHTAPPAAAPSVTTPTPEPVAAAPTPSALPSTPSALPSALPSSTKSAPAVKSKHAAHAKKGKAKGKASAKASHAASPKAAKKPARQRPDQSGLGGISSKRSNDPLDGI